MVALAMLDFGSFISDPASSWILIPTLALLIPIIAIVLEPVKQRMKAGERREARLAYERIAHEKLEVLKTGITMGYSQQELRELDTRLEKLIGEDQIKKLMDPSNHGKLDRLLELTDQNDLESALSMGTGRQKA
jgi:hypothetical protein